MRTYRITISGKTYTVELDDPNASPVQVRVDGKPYEVHVDWEGTDDDAAVGPEVSQAPSGEPATPPAAASPSDRGTRPKAQTRQRPAAFSGGRDDAAATANTLMAPMPGTILTIAVEEGDRVEAGQELCVLEAMKMKNSIKSPRQGTIAEVAVSAGATVAYGDLLMRFQ